MENKKIKVEIVYASESKQHLDQLEVNVGSTIEQVIDISGILFLFPKIDLLKQKVGIFGDIKDLNQVVSEGDRIEIYRPLKVDPKDARKRRAKRM